MKCLRTQGSVKAVALMAVGLTFSVMGYGESSTSAAAPAGASATTAAPVAPTSKMFGTIDLRAEYYNGTNMWDTSNYVQMGYQFNPNFLVSWYQGFDTNIDHAVLGNKPADGINGVLDQGFLRTRVNKIWESSDKTLAFNYENRIYVPTWRNDYAANNITQIYNAFKLVKKVSEVVSLTGVFVVKPEIFRTAGTEEFGPNPAWENRYYFIADFNITSKLSLDVPLLLYQTKYRQYGASAKSGNWGYLLYAWPELDYNFDDNFTVGLAYVTGNMVKPDLSDFTFDEAIKNAAWQFVFTVNL